MNIHEYQAKALLAKYNVSVPKGIVVFTPEEAAAAARELGGPVWVVKAQVHAGGRGKGGGVKVVRSVDEAVEAARTILGMTLVTPQTGAAGRLVRRVYIEECCEIERELYLGLLVDRASSRLVMMASAEGGMEIEEVAARTPEKILKVTIDPAIGMMPFQARQLAFGLGLKGKQVRAATALMIGTYMAFLDTDASLVEINPMVVTKDGAVMALDAKLNFDDSALFRHKDIVALRDADEEDPAERDAAEHDLNYIKLDGSIGCLVNGAGLAMATMDIIKLHGSAPANFLDVGGDAPKERVREAFKIILSDPKVEAILVNIFGGIMRCDVIAEGIIAAAKEIHLEVPLVVRLEGTNVDLGKKLLAESDLAIVSADNLGDAARAVAAAVKGTH
jgi:succinyl-CoA synthetase beta subunit